MNKKSILSLLATALIVCCIVIGASAANNVAAIGNSGYASLQTAINAYNDTTTSIKLTADISEAITINKDVYLDLNGFDVTGAVIVNSGTLYCMDSQTDDYTINDTAGYGVLTNVSGSVAGVPAEANCAEDGYLMVTEGTSLSFHRVNLQIYAMTLRPTNVGLYYKSYFAGDEIVAKNVERFGVALSVMDTPSADNLETKCKYSIFTGFTAGINDGDHTSTLLKNIMKTTNTQSANRSNSMMSVFGRAYILTKNDEYVFGNAACRNLVEQVKLAASDEYWPKYETSQQDAAVTMYRQYTDIMRTWSVNNIESAMVLDKHDPLNDGETLKVLAITSSFGLNTTQLLYDIAVAEGYAPENVIVGRLYTSGCTLEKHLKYAPSTPVYQYTKITGDTTKTTKPGKMQTLYAEGTATLLDGLQDEDWDIIFMQQGAAQAPQLDTYLDANGQNRIDQLKAIVDQYKTNPDARFVWNMLWGYQSDSTVSPFPTLFNGDQMYMYQCNVDAIIEYIVPRTDYDRIVPTGTVIQNARSSYFGDKLCKDTYHLNNIGGALAAYGLYAVITGQELTQINLDIVTASNTNGIGGANIINTPLTAEDKMVIMESVNNALKNPFGVTDSKHPPIDYSSYTYTENLSFLGDSKIAVCPACDQKVTWTEVNKDNLTALTAQGYFGATMPKTTHHLYLSTDITFTSANASKAFLQADMAGINVCLHLNGHNLTGTNCAVAIVTSSAKLNIMGTGTVSGNQIHTYKFRGSTIILNSGRSTDLGAVRLYSGTYIQPKNNDQLAAVSAAQQGGLLEIYEDATITGTTNSYSVCVNTSNAASTSSVPYVETVNIYGGTFNRPVYCHAFGAVTSSTTLNISGGNFVDGIEIADNTTATLSGKPVISGGGLKLADGITVRLGALMPGASIDIDANGAFTVTNTLAADYINYFHPVQSGYNITEANGVLSCTTN